MTNNVASEKYINPWLLKCAEAMTAHYSATRASFRMVTLSRVGEMWQLRYVLRKQPTQHDLDAIEDGICDFDAVQPGPYVLPYIIEVNDGDLPWPNAPGQEFVLFRWREHFPGDETNPSTQAALAEIETQARQKLPIDLAGDPSKPSPRALRDEIAEIDQQNRRCMLAMQSLYGIITTNIRLAYLYTTENSLQLRFVLEVESDLDRSGIASAVQRLTALHEDQTTHTVLPPIVEINDGKLQGIENTFTEFPIYWRREFVYTDADDEV